MSAPLLLMGRTGRPHGIRGEVMADWFGDYKPKAGDLVFLKDGSSEPETYQLEAVSSHKGRLILKLAGIADRDIVSGLAGRTIWMARDRVSPLKDGEVFLADLPGCAVFLENGVLAGVLDHVEFPAGQPVWAITAPDGHEILMPGQPGFIKSLDIESRKIIVSPPEGLLDIYNA